MNTHPYKTLEFDKVLEDLARRTHSTLAAEQIRLLQPLSSPELVRNSLGRISELRSYMDTGESFPIAPFQDIGGYLDLSAAEGSLLTTDDFMPLVDPDDASEIPSYQAYLCLAWLRKVGLVTKQGRQGYTVQRPRDLQRLVDESWQRLHVESHRRAQ